AGQQPVAAELEGVEHADLVPLLQQHGDQGRADVTGTAGDENTHRGLHPWWLESRLERRGLCGVSPAARRDGQFPGPGARPCGLSLAWLRATGPPPLPGAVRSDLAAAVLCGRHYRRVPRACQRQFGRRRAAASQPIINSVAATVATGRLW